MPSTDLDRLMAVNEQLAALVEAGVPLETGLPTSVQSSSAQLERFNAAVARQVGRGSTLTEAVRVSNQVPEALRSLLLLGLQSGQWSTVFDRSLDVAARVDDWRYQARASLLYPLLVCALAYLGSIWFCLEVVPALTLMYDLPKYVPGPALRSVQALRAALPIWAPLPPLVVSLVVLVRVLRGSPPGLGFTWSPALHSISGLLRRAQFAETVAGLLEAGCSSAEAMELAAGASGDRCLTAAIEQLAQGHTTEPVARGKGPAGGLSPLLAWALQVPESDGQRSRALRAVAGALRDSAEARSARLHLLLPIGTLVLIGGGVTLLYGLMLFLPLVEMLLGLSHGEIGGR